MRFIFCYLLDLHKFQPWEIDPNHKTCGRCNITALGVYP